MITMDKKYRHDGDDGAVLSVTASNPWCVVWQAARSGEIYRFTKNGHGSVMDLIEVVPDVVTWARVYVSGAVGPPSDKIQTPGMAVAILRTTIRNGGKSHTDVTVEVLPCDYQEPTP